MRISLTAVFVFASIFGYSQQVETISFIEKSHDFGVVKEEDGPIKYEFKFTNNGAEPVQILNVKASCGCTTPGWSREPITAGESGFIQAQYNPRNRPGKFNKSLTVTTNINETVRLYISGEVTPRLKTPEEEYPKAMGAIRMKSNSINVGKIYINREPITRQYEVYNSSDKVIEIKEKITAPKYIDVTFDTYAIQPKQTVNLNLTYNAGLKDDLGFMNDQIEFYTNEENNNVKELNVYATIEEYFALLSAENLAKAPKLRLENSVVDLGRIKKGQEAKAMINITNSGLTELNIRKLSPNCTCLSGEVTKKIIKPGETIQLDLVFKSEDRRGNQQKSMTIYSDDPKASAQRLTIKAYVED